MVDNLVLLLEDDQLKVNQQLDEKNKIFLRNMNYTIQLNLKSSNLESLILYKILLKRIFNNLNCSYSNFNLPTTKRRITLNKSPHVYKKAREQFEIFTFRSVFLFDTSLTNIPLKYILLNKPKTISFKLKKRK